MSEVCFNCVYSNGTFCTSNYGCHFTPVEAACESCSNNKDNYPDDAKEYLDKIVNDHWSYIEGVLQKAALQGEWSEESHTRIKEIEFHYKTAGKHFWKHACEYYGVGVARPA